MRAHSGGWEPFLVGQPIQEQTIICSPALRSSRLAGAKDLQGSGHSQAGKNIKPNEKGYSGGEAQALRLHPVLSNALCPAAPHSRSHDCGAAKHVALNAVPDFGALYSQIHSQKFVASCSQLSESEATQKSLAHPEPLITTG